MFILFNIGADRSLVTVFLSLAPPRISDNRAALPPSFLPFLPPLANIEDGGGGGPPPKPLGGGGGGGGPDIF